MKLIRHPRICCRRTQPSIPRGLQSTRALVRRAQACPAAAQRTTGLPAGQSQDWSYRSEYFVGLHDTFQQQLFMLEPSEAPSFHKTSQCTPRSIAHWTSGTTTQSKIEWVSFFCSQRRSSMLPFHSSQQEQNRMEHQKQRWRAAHKISYNSQNSLIPPSHSRFT